MSELKTIRLYGNLGKKFGRIHKLAVASPAEAVRALCVLCKGFEAELMQSRDRKIGYKVFIGDIPLSTDNLDAPAGKSVIKIAPAVLGAKSGLGQILLGAAIIGAAFYAPALFASGSESWFASVSGTGGGLFGLAGGYATAASIGMAVGLGGVARMLTNTQTGLSTSDSPNNGASYNFNGTVNTTAQGNPVPLAYGKVWAGGANISTGIYAEDQQ